MDTLVAYAPDILGALVLVIIFVMPLTLMCAHALIWLTLAPDIHTPVPVHRFNYIAPPFTGRAYSAVNVYTSVLKAFNPEIVPGHTPVIREPSRFAYMHAPMIGRVFTVVIIVKVADKLQTGRFYTIEPAAPLHQYNLRCHVPRS